MEKSSRSLFGGSDVGLSAATAVLGVAITIELLGAVEAQFAEITLDGQDVRLGRRADSEGRNRSGDGLDGRVDDERHGLDRCFLDSRLDPLKVLVGTRRLDWMRRRIFGVARERPK